MGWPVRGDGRSHPPAANKRNRPNGKLRLHRKQAFLLRRVDLRRTFSVLARLEAARHWLHAQAADGRGNVDGAA